MTADAPKRGRGRPRKPTPTGPPPLPYGVSELVRGDLDGIIAQARRNARIPEALAEAVERPSRVRSRYWDARLAGADHDEAVRLVRESYDEEERATRRPRGRPPRAEERRLHVAVRVTDDGMEERWRGWARRGGMSLGDLVAAAVEEYGARRDG